MKQCESIKELGGQVYILNFHILNFPSHQKIISPNIYYIQRQLVSRRFFPSGKFLLLKLLGSLCFDKKSFKESLDDVSLANDSCIF